MPSQSRRWASGSPSAVHGRVMPALVSATAWLVRDGDPGSTRSSVATFRDQLRYPDRYRTGSGLVLYTCRAHR